MKKILPMVAAIMFIFAAFYVAKTIPRNNGKESVAIQNNLSEENQNHARKAYDGSENGFWQYLSMCIYFTMS